MSHSLTKLLRQLQTWAAVLGLLGIVAAAGAIKYAVASDTATIKEHTTKIQMLSERMATQEQMAKDIPEIKADIKAILLELRKH